MTITQRSPDAGEPATVPTIGLFIGGEWVDGGSGETFDSTSPANGEPVGTFPRSDEKDVQEAVAAAKAAF